MHERLLKRIKNQDRVAQKRLYLDFVKYVSHISMRYINDAHFAQDATQNTFVRVFQNIDAYDPKKGKFKSWIGKIAVNEAIAVLRSKKTIQFTQTEIPNDFIEGSIDSRLFNKLELADVTRVIKLLDNENRIIMDLFFYEEYSHKEIAEILDISVEFSRVKLYRAKTSFYDKWKKISKNEVERAI